jgi:hypothetical protein
MREITKDDVVFTRFGTGVIRGTYSNYTTDGVIVEIRGVNHYLARDDVDRIQRVASTRGLRAAM